MTRDPRPRHRAGRGIGGVSPRAGQHGYDVTGVDVVSSRRTRNRPVRGPDLLARLGAEFCPSRVTSPTSPPTRGSQGSVRPVRPDDVLVNNAGVGRSSGGYLETTPEALIGCSASTPAHVLFTQRRPADGPAGPGIAGPKPAIIFITSISAVVSSPSRASTVCPRPR